MDMASDVDEYRALQQHLDQMPVGFPATKSGIEIKLLKHLFTPEEARLAAKLPFSFVANESIEDIYPRAKDLGLTKETLEQKLDAMSGKGLISYRRDGSTKYYSCAILAIGIYEYQVNKLSKSKEFMDDFFRYILEAYGDEMFSTKINQLRIVPVEKSITPAHPIANYDSVRKIIETSEGPFMLANCICRQARDTMGKTCHHTQRREVCMGIGQIVSQYADFKWARIVSKEEMLANLQKAEEEGLVLQAGNIERPEFICACCGCCCTMMKGLKQMPRPVEYISSNFHAEVDASACSGCATRVDRCNINAVTVPENVAVVNLDRCLGCGVCVSTCPSDAIHLVKNMKEIAPPATFDELYHRIMAKKVEVVQEKKEKEERRLQRREERKNARPSGR